MALNETHKGRGVSGRRVLINSQMDGESPTRRCGD